MDPSTYFANEEERRVAGSAYLRRAYGHDIPQLDPQAAAQEASRRPAGRTYGDPAIGGREGICRVCKQRRYLSAGHTRCGSCRGKGKD